MVNLPGLQVLCRHTTHGQHAVRATGDPRGDARLGTDPDAVFQHNGPCDEVERGFLVVVVAAEEQGALGNANMRPDGDLIQIVNPHLLADPAVVADGEFPRVLDGHTGLDDHA